MLRIRPVLLPSDKLKQVLLEDMGMLCHTIIVKSICCNRSCESESSETLTVFIIYYIQYHLDHRRSNMCNLSDTLVPSGWQHVCYKPNPTSSQPCSLYLSPNGRTFRSMQEVKYRLTFTMSGITVSEA